MASMKHRVSFHCWRQPAYVRGLGRFGGALCWEGALACCSAAHAAFDCGDAYGFQRNSLSGLTAVTF